MMPRPFAAACAALAFTATTPALAGPAEDGFRWLRETDEILAEGAIWNDRLGDGADRYKTGGMTQSWIIPQGALSEAPWFADHAAGIELQGRGFIATPDNTQGAAHGDRPFAQFVGIGAYLRTISAPEPVAGRSTLTTETRVGAELGWQGEPLPLFEIQEALHNGSVIIEDGNTIDGEMLLNLEARRTWRLNLQLDVNDIDLASFIQASAGMRENSGRVGADVIYGSSLEGRTWNHEPAIGALIPGGSMPRDGFNWLVWVGGDAGYVASDAFLDGGFEGNDGRAVARERLTYRARAGVMFEYGGAALVYSVNWLSREFKAQTDSQIIGAVSIKFRF